MGPLVYIWNTSIYRNIMSEIFSHLWFISYTSHLIKGRIFTTEVMIMKRLIYNWYTITVSTMAGVSVFILVGLQGHFHFYLSRLVTFFDFWYWVQFHRKMKIFFYPISNKCSYWGKEIQLCHNFLTLTFVWPWPHHSLLYI